MVYVQRRRVLLVLAVVGVVLTGKFLWYYQTGVWHDLVEIESGVFTNSIFLLKSLLFLCAPLMVLLVCLPKLRATYKRTLLLLVWRVVGLLAVLLGWHASVLFGVDRSALLVAWGGQVGIYIVFALLIQILLADEFPDGRRQLLASVFVLCLAVGFLKSHWVETIYSQQMLCAGQSGKLLLMKQTLSKEQHISPHMRAAGSDRKEVVVTAPGCEGDGGVCDTTLAELEGPTKGCTYLPQYVFELIEGMR